MHYVNRHSDGILRECSRCGKELTDAASRECGVGPICRNKDNAIFARQIPANLNVATALIMSFGAENFHNEISAEFDAVKQKYLSRCSRIQRTNGDMAAVRLSGGDFRDTVDWLDKSLSYRGRSDHRTKVIKLIQSMGYSGLASVLSGDACMSEAKLYVEGDHIHLSGKSNKRGWLAMRREFAGGSGGLQAPRYRGDKTPYRVSVVHAEKFAELAVRYWPFIEENVDEVVKAANKRVKKLPRAARNAAAQPAGRPVARIVKSQSYFSLTFPWHGTRAEMLGMIDAMKNVVPRRERSYNAVSKAWRFNLEHERTIKNIISNRYVVTVEG